MFNSHCAVDYMDFALGGQRPFRRKDPWPVPGRIQAEDFDEGGEGVAFHDTSFGNQGKSYRNEDVDISGNNEFMGVGWTDAGEWLEYTVVVARSGEYSLKLRIANADNDDAVFRVMVDGNWVTGPIQCPLTHSWDSWKEVSAGSIHLESGSHVLRLLIDGHFAIDYMELLSF